MDITKMSVEALKALAYDEMAKIQLSQQNLQMINQEIAKKQEESKQPLEAEVVKSDEPLKTEVVKAIAK